MGKMKGKTRAVLCQKPFASGTARVQYLFGSGRGKHQKNNPMIGDGGIKASSQQALKISGNRECRGHREQRKKVPQKNKPNQNTKTEKKGNKSKRPGNLTSRKSLCG